jgi:hypothetical protein
MKVNPKFDQIQFVSSRKNYNVKESIEKLLASVIKGDSGDSELLSDASFVNLRNTSVDMQRKTMNAETLPVIEKSTEKKVLEKSTEKKVLEKSDESQGSAKKNGSAKKRLSLAKKDGLLDGSVTDIPHEASILPATGIDSQERLGSNNQI